MSSSDDRGERLATTVQHPDQRISDFLLFHEKPSSLSELYGDGECTLPEMIINLILCIALLVGAGSRNERLI